MRDSTREACTPFRRTGPNRGSAPSRRWHRSPIPPNFRAMDISSLDLSEAAAATALWDEAGLIRAWNDPQADIQAALSCPTSTILAARDGARLIGTVMVGYDGHRGWLYYLAVANDHRGTGLGRALVEAAEQWLGAQGARVIRLMVRAENERVVGFYRALGYEDGNLIAMGKRLES